MVIDNENDITYDYDDLDDDYLWNKWDFHRGDDGEFVMDYSARYGIEFDDEGGDDALDIDVTLNCFNIIYPTPII